MAVAAPRGLSSPAHAAAEVVVGVGASAGGLEAMLALFSHVSSNGKVAYVVAQHMASTDHGDLVAKLIGHQARLPVQIGQDGQTIHADTIVFIPAGGHGVVVDGRLRLLPPSPKYVSTPSVDVLLESLASQFAHRSVGVILSGTGWDGSRGCNAIAQAGGCVVVQNFEEAAFSGMPEASSAATGARSKKAADIGDWLAAHLNLPQRSRSAATPAHATTLAPDVDGSTDQELREVIARIKAVTDLDFAEYRPETLLRRLQARRASHGLNAEQYLSLLMRDERETRRLQELFLVSFSGFWRDRECFEVLATHLTQRLANRRRGDTVRAWVPGCASGEEAYTIAALLVELSRAAGLELEVEVVGSDLNADALELARAGRYGIKSIKEAPDDWVRRWLIPEGSEFVVQPDLKRRVRFEQADLEKGLPASLGAGHIDLVTCRNMLIYFLPAKQQRLLATCGRALRPEGLMVIGPSESLIGPASAMFRMLHSHHRIYARKI